MKIHDFAESKRVDLRQVMDFSSDVNALGPSNKARHAVRKGIKYLSFPPDKKLRYLRRYICRKELVEGDNVVFAQDPSHILSALIQVAMPKTVAVLSPVSKRQSEILGRHAIKVIPCPVNRQSGFSIDVNRLVQSIQTADMAVIVNPHDITGALLTGEDISFLIQEAGRLGKVLVFDETYIEFTKAVSAVRTVIGSQNAITLRSFSVFHALAGLPVSYGIGAPGLVEKISNVMLPEAASLAHMAALASLRDKGYSLRTLKFIEEEKRFMKGQLKDTEGVEVVDTSCNFMILFIKRSMQGLGDLFSKVNILIDEYIDEEGNTLVKLPVKTHKFNARFVKSLKKIIQHEGTA